MTQPELFLVEPPLENGKDAERQVQLLKQRNDVVKLNAEQPAEMYSLAKVRCAPMTRRSVSCLVAAKRCCSSMCWGSSSAQPGHVQLCEYGKPWPAWWRRAKGLHVLPPICALMSLQQTAQLPSKLSQPVRRRHPNLR